MNNEPLKSREEQLDELLSEFTDRILSDEGGADMPEAATRDELTELRKTILLMKSATRKARASGGADKRIRGRLMKEWVNLRREPRRSTWNWNVPRLALAGGFAVLVLIGVVTLANPTTTPLTATSDGAGIWSPILVAVGIVIIVLILWRNRHD